MSLIARRAFEVPPFHAMAMNRRATALERAGRRIYHLHAGQPSSGAPQRALDEVQQALGEPLGYTDTRGLHRLREAIATRYGEWYGLDIHPDRISVVAGASAGFTLAFLAAFDTGARVGVIEPGYPCYRNGLVALDIEPVRIAVGPEHRWAPTPDLLDAAAPLDGLIIASPSNPTGTVLGTGDLRAIVDYCHANDITLITDEIYHGMTYDEPATSALAMSDEVVVVNSFSKYYSMTGWRVGWTVVPDEMVDVLERLQSNLYICAPHISQVAAYGALGATEELEGHLSRYRTNRRLLVDGLAEAGIDRIAEADGAFYVYADIGHLTDALGYSSMRICERWLDELGIAATPGIDFDLARGDRFVRFSYAGATSDIEGACTVLAAWSP